MRAKARHGQAESGHSGKAASLAIGYQIDVAAAYLATLAGRSGVSVGASLRLPSPLDSASVDTVMKEMAPDATLVALLLEPAETRTLSASVLVQALRRSGRHVAAVILDDSKDWPGAFLLRQAGVWTTGSFEAVIELQRLLAAGWTALPGPRIWMNVRHPGLRAWLSAKARQSDLVLGSARSSDCSVQVVSQADGKTENRSPGTLTFRMVKHDGGDQDRVGGVDATLDAIKGLSILSTHRADQPPAALRPPEGVKMDRIREVLEGPSRLLSFGTGLRLLSDAGIPVPAFHLVDSPSAASRQAQKLGESVDLHLSAPSLDPDTAAAFFRLGIASAPAVRMAFSSLMAAGGDAGHKTLGVIVMPHLQGPFAQIDAMSRKNEGRMIRVRIENQPAAMMRAPLSLRDAAVLAAGAGVPSASVPVFSSLLYAVAWLFDIESQHLDRIAIHRIPLCGPMGATLPFVWVKGD